MLSIQTHNRNYFNIGRKLEIEGIREENVVIGGVSFHKSGSHANA